MRDDRMGDITHHLVGMSLPQQQAAVDEKLAAKNLQLQNYALWTTSIKPHLTDDVLADKVDASVEYGVLLYSIIHPAWRIMAQGALHSSKTHANAFNKTELAASILAYLLRGICIGT